MACRDGSSLRALGHFLAVGGLLFAATALLGGGPSEPPPRPAAMASAPGTPTDPDEEVLFREALARGLHRHDPVVRLRLLRNMRFLGDGTGDPDALLRRARALGMERSDLVVRRRLVQRMRAELEAPGRAAEPREEELAAWLAAHAERYALPARVRFEQRFFDPVRRGADGAARAARTALAAAGAGDPEAGDPFLVSRQQPLQSEREAAKLFGPEFARALLELPVGRWSGPIGSSYGSHLVRVHAREPAAVPALERVRARVRADLLDARGRAAAAAALERLRERHGAHPPGDVAAAGDGRLR